MYRRRERSKSEDEFTVGKIFGGRFRGTQLIGMGNTSSLTFGF